MELKHFLWEYFPTEKFRILRSNVGAEFTGIRLWRGTGYRIHFELTGQFDQDADFDSNPLLQAQKIGNESIFAAWVIAATEGSLQRLAVNGFHFQSEAHSPQDGNKLLITFKGEITGRLKFKVGRREKPAYIMYWFLNAPDFAYTRSQSTELTHSLDYSVTGVLNQAIVRPGPSRASRSAILFEVNGKSILAGTVPPDITGNQSGLFLRVNAIDALSDKEIETIRDIFAFCAAQEILPIGRTAFNSVSSPIWTKAKSTYRDDLSFLKFSGRMPLPLSFSEQSRIDPEQVLTDLISQSMTLNFPLHKILWLIRASWQLPLDLKLQPLATAFDIIRTAWFKSSQSVSRGRNFPDERYAEIIEKFLPQIHSELGENSDNGILRKIRHANEMSLEQKTKVLFAELGLTLGPLEGRALAERHKAVHGTDKLPDYQALLSHLRTFECMLNRIILRLLNYPIYSDRTSYGNPLRAIAEPPQGEESPLEKIMRTIRSQQS